MTLAPQIHFIQTIRRSLLNRADRGRLTEPFAHRLTLPAGEVHGNAQIDEEAHCQADGIDAKRARLFGKQARYRRPTDGPDHGGDIAQPVGFSSPQGPVRDPADYYAE